MGMKPFDNRKNNKGKNDRPAKVPRYKGKNVDPMGDVTRMGQTAIRMFRDIASGRGKPIDKYTEFLNRDFVVAAINEVDRKIREEHILVFALQSTYGNSSDIQIDKMMNDHRKAYEGWCFIRETLGYIMATGDPSFVGALINRLPDYRYVLH